eukprot:scaffold12731_cov43-Attheya_sp.AAC.1
MGGSGAAGGFLLGATTALAAVGCYCYIKREKESKNDRRKAMFLRGSANAMSMHSATGAAAAGISVSFLSDIMMQLWSYINAAGSAKVKEIVEPMFKEMLPGPLANLHFEKVDLGEVPMSLVNIVVHEVSEDGFLQFDMDVFWDGTCDIRLAAPFVGSFGVKEIKFSGRLSILLKPLTNQLPIVSAIQYAFINPPSLDLEFTGLAQIVDFQLIRDMVGDILQSMMVLPNRMMYKMDLTSSFLDTYQPPIGITRITALRGRGFQIEKILIGPDDIPDVYCDIQLGPTKWRTSTIKNNLSPEWNEAGDFLLSDHDQIVSVNAVDEDFGLDPDDDLGTCKFSVGEMLLAGKTTELELQKENGTGTGAYLTLQCDVCELIPDLASFETEKGKNMLCGLLTVLVTQAFDIPLEKEDASTFVSVSYGEHNFCTGVVVDAPGYDALNPLYDSAFHVPLTHEMVKSKDKDVVLKLMNGEDTILSTITLTHDELVNAPYRTVAATRKVGDHGAALQFRVSFAGIRPPEGKSESSSPNLNAVESPLQHPAPSPVKDESSSRVRITAVKGSGFKVEKKGWGKKDVPDVYCNIKFGSSPKIWRTVTADNTTEPVWNESSEFILAHHGQILRIDSYDQDNGKNDNDDFLGGFTVTVGKLLLAGGKRDIELTQKGKGTGAFISLHCEVLDS